MRLYDNTRVSAYKTCPRYYMFRHELHWKVSGSSLPLIFGSAWHGAMEVVWEHIGKMPKLDLAKLAFDRFIQIWCEEGMPPPSDIDYDMEKELSPRTPGRALEILIAYIDRLHHRADDFQLLHIEKPFIVPLDPNDDSLFYIGRIDKVVKYRDRIIGIEHKTTTLYKKDGPFRSSFLDSFSPNSQVDGYLYALHLTFPDMRVGGVWVDATLVHKNEEGFTFIPVERQLQHLDAWLWEVNWWIEQIEKQRKAAAGLEGQHILAAWPKNTNSCINYATTCPYIVPCKAWPNPLGKEIPPGFVKEIWDPLDHIKGLDHLRRPE